MHVHLAFISKIFHMSLKKEVKRSERFGGCGGQFYKPSGTGIVLVQVPYHMKPQTSTMDIFC
jgi:hypothetical protein